MKGLMDRILVWIVLAPCITSGRDTIIIMVGRVFHENHLTEAPQSSHHGHHSYNIQGLGHVHHRPPVNITATNGVGVDFMCKVRQISGQ